MAMNQGQRANETDWLSTLETTAIYSVFMQLYLYIWAVNRRESFTKKKKKKPGRGRDQKRTSIFGLMQHYLSWLIPTYKINLVPNTGKRTPIPAQFNVTTLNCCNQQIPRTDGFRHDRKTSLLRFLIQKRRILLFNPSNYRLRLLPYLPPSQ